MDVAPTEILNAHFPPDLPADKIRTYMGHEWLPPVFFDMSSPQHPHLALATLMNSLQGPNRFRQIPSGTWRGGPNGARWIVAVVARIHMTFTMIQLNNDVPEQIEKVLDMSDFRRSQTLFQSLVAWLNKSFKDTCDTLRTTYEQRVTAWKAEMTKACLSHQAADKLPREAGCRATRYGNQRELTNGLPQRQEELEECFVKISETNPELTLAEEQDHVSMLRRLSTRQPADEESEAEFSDKDSSVEDISLPDVGSD
jgi:hypothetical protein